MGRKIGTRRNLLLRYYAIIGTVIIFGFVQYKFSNLIKDKDTDVMAVSDVQQDDLLVGGEVSASEDEDGGEEKVDMLYHVYFEAGYHNYNKTQDDEETQQNDETQFRDTIQSREKDSHTTRDGGETQKNN